MKVIIIDDEQSAIDALEQRLKKYDDVTIVATTQSGFKGISLVRSEEPDLLFLDVELPDLSGLEFLEQMENATQEKPCRVIIYTAHSNYMLPSFRGKAFDFLLKPIDPEDLDKIMERCRTEAEKDAEEANTAKKDNEKVVLYTNATDFRLVDMRDMGLFQYNHELRFWEVVVASRKEPLKLKRSINFETLTSIDPRYVQVSQRHIININYLLEVNDNVCRFFPPFDKIDYVRVGRQYRKKLLDRFCTL